MHMHGMMKRTFTLIETSKWVTHFENFEMGYIQVLSTILQLSI